MRYILLVLLITALGFSQEAAVEIEIPPEEMEGGLPPIEKMPELKHYAEAPYPKSALKQGIEGTVVLEIIISDSGSVDSIALSRGIHPALDSAALAAVKNFKFSPAMAGGENIAVAIQYSYTFSLADVVNTIPEYVNFKGRLREKGTRAPVQDGLVAVSILDSAMDTNIRIPFSLYMKKIGSMEGQFLEDGSLATTTDGEGYFEFKSLPACSIKVSFPITGYRPVSSVEIIEAGKLIEMDYRISRESYDEYEIVVYGKAEKVEVAKQNLSISEIKRAPGFGGDAIKVVRALPGVARPSFVSGDIIIRGSGAEDTRFYLDGLKVPRLFHFGGLRSVYSSDLLSSIDMYPGGFGTRYGGAVGGVVEIKGRKSKNDRWHGKLDVNMLDAGGMVEGPLSENLSLQTAGRYSYIGKFIEAATKDAPTTVVPIYRDVYARLDWNMGKKHHSFFTYSHSSDNLEIIASDARGGSDELEGEENEAISDDWYHMAVAGLDSRFSDKLENEFRLGALYGKNASEIFGFQEFDLTNYGLYLREEFKYRPTSYLTLKSGLDVDVDRIDYSLNIVGATGILGNEDVQYFSTMGAYANLELKPFKNLMLVPGLRYDYFADIEEGQPSFRLSSRYEYIPGLSVKGSAGSYSQFPRPWGQATDEAWGNPDLPATRGEQYVVGHEWQISELLSLDFQTYYNLQHDIPNYTDSLRPGTGTPYNFLPDMEGRMYGLEVMLRHDQGKRFFGWVSYTLSRSERKTGNPFNEELAASGEEWDPNAWILSQFDQTHNLQLLGSWKLPANWDAGFRFRYVTGNPTTPFKSYTDNEFQFNSESLEYEALLGKAYSDRVGPFVQLDLRIDKKFVYKNWMLSSYLDFRNVNYFFYNSPEFYEYNYDKSKRETIGAIFLPSVGITAEF